MLKFFFPIITFVLPLFYTAVVCADTMPASGERILICGVCKNTAPAAANTIANIEKLGSRFADYAAIIYENNSKDETAAIYTKWAAKNPRVEFISEQLTNEELSEFREENIARARNIVLSIAKRPAYSEYKYLIMADLDFTTEWPIDEIVKCTEMPIEWDCISANGVMRAQSGVYYDRYAFRSKNYPLGDEVIGSAWWKLLANTLFNLRNHRSLMPVYSAFGGLAIYKTEVITKYAYSGKVTDDLSDYYKLIVAESSLTNRHINQYLKTLKLEVKDLSEIPIVFHRSVCCEHVPLHASMALDGHDKFFVDPLMVINYNFPPKMKNPHKPKPRRNR